MLASAPAPAATPADDARRALRDLVRRARPLYERLDAFRARPPASPAAPTPLAERRLAAWRDAMASGDAAAFALRLAWDGLDEASALALLADDGPADDGDEPLPEWAAAVGEAYGEGRGARVPAGERAPADRALDAGDPLPFEEVLLPLVRWARARVAAAAGSACGLLDDAAHAALERALLRRLTHTASRALFARLAATRAVRASGGLGALFGAPAGGGAYQALLEGMRGGGALRFFAQYPVLARLLGTAAVLWAETAAELLGRLDADRGEIEAVLGGGRALGRVAALQCDASDFHSGGRSVFILAFEGGARVVYKPRPLALEAAFRELAAWLARRPGAPELRSPALVRRPTHGWIAFVEGGACADRAAVRRYYERCGALLAVAYALGGTDFHLDNLLASGEHPVLIDLETLLSHRFDLVEKVPNQAFGAEVARAAAQRSVLAVHMLPRLKVAASGMGANAGALGCHAPLGDGVVEATVWAACNQDGMRLARTRVRVPQRASNLAVLDGRPVPAGEHVDAVAEGFARTYRTLAAHRAELLAPGGPVERLRGCPVRFILHHTSLYATLLERCLHPTHLADGVARGIQLDALARPLVSLGARPAVWPALRSEHHDLERMDVPLFAPSSDSTALPLSSGGAAEGCFAADAYGEAVRRLGALGEADLEAQLSLVHAAFRADAARGLAAGPGASAAAAPPVRASGDAAAELAGAALAGARAVAAELARAALRAENGEAGWIGASYEPRARRFDAGAGAANLLDGYVGTAFFLAALEQADPGAGHGALAMAALRPLVDHLDDYAAMFRLRRDRDLGAGTGTGSLLYALPRLAEWLGEPRLLDAALTLAALLDGAPAPAAHRCDLLSGAAGLIPGLLALHRAGAPDALARALAVGEGIVGARVCDEATGTMAWTGPLGRPEAGLAHGQAGIACALLRLAVAAGDDSPADAAREAMRCERSLLGAGLAAAPEASAAWSAGATGVGLARLAALDADGGEARADVEAALERTRAHLFDGGDSACAGVPGRVEFFLCAGAALGRPELVREGQAAALAAVERARARGGWRTGWEPFSHPGLFVGMAGVGYQLLRAAHPERFPAVLAWE